MNESADPLSEFGQVCACVPVVLPLRENSPVCYRHRGGEVGPGGAPSLVGINLQRLTLLEGFLICLVLIRKSSVVTRPAIARRNKTPIAQIAHDFGISDAAIRRWLAKAFEVSGSLGV
jgi:hypothetical protein